MSRQVWTHWHSHTFYHRTYNWCYTLELPEDEFFRNENEPHERSRDASKYFDSLANYTSIQPVWLVLKNAAAYNPRFWQHNHTIPLVSSTLTAWISCSCKSPGWYSSAFVGTKSLINFLFPSTMCFGTGIRYSFSQHTSGRWKSRRLPLLINCTFFEISKKKTRAFHQHYTSIVHEILV